MTNDDLIEGAKRYARLYCEDTQSAVPYSERRMPRVRSLGATTVYFFNKRQSEKNDPSQIPWSEKCQIVVENESGKCVLARGGQWLSTEGISIDDFIGQTVKLARASDAEPQPSIILKSNPVVNYWIKCIKCLVIYFGSDASSEKIGVCLECESGKFISGGPLESGNSE